MKTVERASGQQPPSPLLTCDDLLASEEERFRDERQSRAQLWSALMAKLEIDEETGLGTKVPGFREKVLRALRTIASKPTGRTLLNGIVKLNNRIKFVPAPTGISHAKPVGKYTFLMNDDGTPNAGSANFIYIDPDRLDSHLVALDEHGDEQPMPFFITMAHELIHAIHFDAGCGQTAHERGTISAEENNTTNGPGIDENDIRREHGLPLRRSYREAWDTRKR